MTLPCRTLGVALVELSGWLLIFSTWFTSFTVLFPFSLLIAIFFIASSNTGKVLSIKHSVNEFVFGDFKSPSYGLIDLFWWN